MAPSVELFPEKPRVTTTTRSSVLSARSVLLAVCVVAAVFLVAAYGNDLRAQRGRQVSYWPSGAVRTQGEALRYPDGRVERDGPYLELHENGAVHLKGRYRRGKPEGVWREYDREGRLLKEGSYRGGKADGLWHYYHPGTDEAPEELQWDRGRVVEDGRRVEVDEPNAPPRIAWTSQLLSTLGALLWLLAPLPLLFVLHREGDAEPGGASDGRFPAAAGVSVAAGRDGGDRAPACDSREAGSTQLVALSVGWALLQLAVALVLALAGGLAPAPFFLAELLLLIGGGVLWWRRGRPLPCLGILARWRGDPRLAALMTAVLILTIAVVVKTLLTPMTDWDGLAYHLPLMAEWLQHHRLVDVPALGQTARYPSSWELLSLTGYFPFREDLLFTLPAVGAWILLGLSVFTLARRWGAAAAEAGAAALLLLALPLVLLQTEELKSDLPLAAVFLSALVLGGLFATPGSRSRRSLFWLTLGLLCGMKASGGAYALLALGAVEGWRGAAGAVAEGKTPTKRPVAWLAPVGAVSLAAFWYLRNFVELGNPLGHVRVALLGHTVFPGDLSRAELWHTTFFALFRPLDGADWRALWTAGRQWLGLGFALLLVAAAAALVAEGSRREGRRPALLVVLLLAAGVLLFAVTPFSGDNGSHGWRITPWVGQALRYGLPGLAILAVAAAKDWPRLGLSSWPTTALAVGACAWSAALRVAPPRPALWLAVGLGALLSAGLLVWPGPEESPAVEEEEGAATGPGGKATAEGRAARGRWRRWPRRVVPAIAAGVLVFALTGGLARLRDGRELRRRILYDLPYLHTLTAPPREIVGVAMTQLRYPFYGRDLRRRVMDVSSHDQPREIWLRRLDALGVEVVAVGPRPVRRTFAAPEDDLRRWLEAPGAPFTRLPGVGRESGEGIVFYRYRPRSSPDAGPSSSTTGPSHSETSPTRPSPSGTKR